MATMLDRLVTEIVFEPDNTGLQRSERQVNRYIDTINQNLRRVERGFSTAARQVDRFTDGLRRAARASAMPAIVLGVSAIGVSELAKEITREVSMAAVVDVDLDLLKSIEAVTLPIGLDFEAVADLGEELANKVGESRGLGEMVKPLEEGLDILGIKWKEFQKLSNSDGLAMLLDTAMELEDRQAGAAALDIMLGGDANKILQAIRMRGKSTKELVEEYRRLNIETDRSRKGAVQYGKAYASATSALGSYAKFLTGIVGIHNSAGLQRFGDWLRDNQDMLRERGEAFVLWLGNVLGTVWNAVQGAYNILAAWVTATANLWGVAKSSVVGFITVLWLLARHPVVFAISALVLALDDLNNYLKGNTSVIGELLPAWGKLTKHAEALNIALGEPADLRWWDILLEAVKGIGLAIGDLVMWTVNGFMSMATTAQQWLTNMLTIVVTGLVNGFIGGFDSIGDAGSNLVSALGSIFSTFFLDTVPSFIMGMVDKALGYIGNLISGVQSAMSSIGSFLGGGNITVKSVQSAQGMLDNAFKGSRVNIPSVSPSKVGAMQSNNVSNSSKVSNTFNIGTNVSEARIKRVVADATQSSNQQAGIYSQQTVR